MSRDAWHRVRPPIFSSCDHVCSGVRLVGARYPCSGLSLRCQSFVWRPLPAPQFWHKSSNNKSYHAAWSNVQVHMAASILPWKEWSNFGLQYAKNASSASCCAVRGAHCGKLSKQQASRSSCVHCHLCHKRCQSAPPHFSRIKIKRWDDGKNVATDAGQWMMEIDECVKFCTR